MIDTESGFICQYCGKICKNANAQQAHEYRCPKNSHRIIPSYKHKQQKCEICGRFIGGSTLNYQRHLDAHLAGKKSVSTIGFNEETTGLACQFCGMSKKTRNALVNHERFCKSNPARSISVFETTTFKDKNYRPWNKGLTTATDERIATSAEKISKTLIGRPGHPISDEQKEQLRLNALQNGLGGFNYRKSKVLYRGIKLDSSYEEILARDLDANQIRWERPSRIPYHMNDKLHYYTPDFYLPDYNIYLDPKNDFLINNINPALGYSDVDKINQVMLEANIKIFILTKYQLSWSAVKKLLDSLD